MAGEAGGLRRWREERLTKEDEKREMESGEVKVDRDEEGSLTKEGEEREMESDEVKVKQDGVAMKWAER